jgi:uncharacterized protein YndB with AHSA1/START domain
MPSPTPPTAIQKVVRLRAPSEAVWRALAEPEMLAGWFPDRVEGELHAGAEGAWIFERFGLRVNYKVTAREDGRTLSMEFCCGSMRSALEFHLRSDGEECVLEVLDQMPESDPEQRASTDSGWVLALATLDHWLRLGAGPERASWFALRFAEYQYGDLAHWFRSEHGLAQWLTKSGALGPVGSRYELVLFDDTPMHGTVLAHTAHETLLSWDEECAVLAFKAFQYGEAGPALAIQGSGWGMSPEHAAEHEGRFAHAMSRLVSALTSR